MTLDADRIRKLLEDGYTPEQIADQLQLRWEEDTWWEPGYHARTSNDVEVYYPDVDDPYDAAEEYTNDEAYPRESQTYWIRVRVWRCGYALSGKDKLDFVEEDHFIRITKEPEELPCTCDTGHEWCTPYEVLGGIKENPGCWGHGGGVRYREVCRHCGSYMTVDTWAQDPETGEQGLKSVSYEPADEKSLAWIERRAAQTSKE